jgi:fumarate hydratase subunit alpha
VDIEKNPNQFCTRRDVMTSEISTDQISVAIAKLCVTANIHLPSDIQTALISAAAQEQSLTGRAVLQELALNARTAAERHLPICQDTGMVIVFADIGQDTHIVGGDFETAIHAGVARGYKEGYLRASVVTDPLIRQNSGDNTPAVIHSRITGQGRRYRFRFGNS